jgi:hypothetical protein
MIEHLLLEKEERARPGAIPHLSHSRINHYLLPPY